MVAATEAVDAEDVAEVEVVVAEGQVEVVTVQVPKVAEVTDPVPTAPALVAPRKIDNLGIGTSCNGMTPWMLNTSPYTRSRTNRQLHFGQCHTACLKEQQPEDAY